LVAVPQLPTPTVVVKSMDGTSRSQGPNVVEVVVDVEVLVTLVLLLLVVVVVTHALCAVQTSVGLLKNAPPALSGAAVDWMSGQVTPPFLQRLALLTTRPGVFLVALQQITADERPQIDAFATLSRSFLQLLPLSAPFFPKALFTHPTYFA
jgi:hypothetical protein